jgi:hypothetical protein
MSLLLRGAEIIEANGFVQHAYFKDIKDSRSISGWRRSKDCPVCPRAALAIAAGKEPDFMVMLNDAGLTAAESDPVACQEIRDAELRFALYLIREQGAETALTDGEVIENWADVLERTQPQVVGAMRAADEYRPAGTR